MNIKQKINHVKEKIHELEEYLTSDCCKQCLMIIKSIEEYQEEIIQLEDEFFNTNDQSYQTDSSQK